MKKTAVVGTTAAVTAAAGFATTFWAEARLSQQGAWTESGMSAGRLDFTVAAVLLVGATLVVLALILALALAIEAWLDGENRRDARAAERRALRRAARDRTRIAAQEMKAPRRDEAPAPSTPGIRTSATSKLASLTASTKRLAYGVSSASTRDPALAPDSTAVQTLAESSDRESASGTAHRVAL